MPIRAGRDPSPAASCTPGESVTACTAGAYPTELELKGAAPVSDLALEAAAVAPTSTLTLSAPGLGRAPAAMSAATPEADQTRVALQVPTQQLEGRRLATETPVSVIDSLAGGGTLPSLAARIQNWWRSLIAQLSLGRILLILMIAALLLFILLRGWLKRQ